MSTPDRPVSETSLQIPPVTPMVHNEHQTKDTIMSDLEGAQILLDSVLDAFGSLSKNASQNQPFLTILENQLGQMSRKISQTVEKSINTPLTLSPSPPSISATEKTKSFGDIEDLGDPATLYLLERYSKRLLKMVERKMEST
ncbi:hypothetical protein CLU79DRAFT_714816 [Phycomyces nitens]|nr:hypothetical protein CLU79DRAFT_714816 [Phycomyces nitens]